MEDRLESLSGQSLPGLPSELRAQVEVRVKPILRKRRVRRRTGLACAAAVMLVTLGYLGHMTPWDVLSEVGERVAKGVAGRLDHYRRFRVFDEKSLEELLALRDELKARHGSVSADYVVIPIEAFIESGYFMVQGVVSKVVFDREQLIEDLKAERVRPLYMTVEFEVVESYPVLQEEAILVSSAGEPEDMPPGKAFIMALKRENGFFRPMYGFGAQGIYRIEGEGADATVFRNMPIEKAWEFIRNLHGAIHGTETEDHSRKTQQRVETLMNGTLEEARLALRVLSAARDDALTGEILIEALERQYDFLVEQDKNENHELGPARHRIHTEVDEYAAFARRTLELLYPLADETIVDRLLDLYLDDMSGCCARVFDEREYATEVFRFALKHPGPARRERINLLLGKTITYRDDRGGRVALVKPDYTNLRLLALTPGEDIDEIVYAWGHGELVQLRKRMQDHENIVRRPKDRVEAFLAEGEGGSGGLLLHLKLCIRRNDGAVVAALKKKPISSIADLVWLRLPDPAFVPALRTAIASDDWRTYRWYSMMFPPMFDALDACGERQDALRLAREALRRAIPDESLDAFDGNVMTRLAALRYLGRTGDVSVTSAIDPFLTDEILSEYEKAHGRAFRATVRRTERKRRRFLEGQSPGRRSRADQLRIAALLALTRLGDPRVVDEWRALYSEDDVPKQVIAAVALYYLGDDTSRDLIEAFRRHDERGWSDIHRYWLQHGSTGEFQRTIKYLRSLRTDALFLERIQHGLDNGDHDLIRDFEFLAAHADKVLPALLKHVEGKDWQSRRNASSCLKSILGAGPDWDDRFIADPPLELVERWHREVEVFLSDWRRPEAMPQ